MKPLNENLLLINQKIRNAQYSRRISGSGSANYRSTFKVNTTCLDFIPICFLHSMFHVSDNSTTGYNKLFMYVERNSYQNETLEAFNCFLDNESYYNQVFEYVKCTPSYDIDLSIDNKDIVRGMKSIEEPVNNVIQINISDLYSRKFMYSGFIDCIMSDTSSVLCSKKFSLIVGNNMVIDYHTNTVLFCLTLKKEYKSYYGLHRNLGRTIDNEIFTFVIDYDFYTDPSKKYTKKLLKDLKDYVLNQHIDIDVELVDGVDFYNDVFINTESFSGTKVLKAGTSISEQVSFNTEIQYEMLEQKVLHNKLALNKITIV